MKSKKLNRKFFERSTLEVARDLLGKFLVRKVGRKIISAMITEVEAYIGSDDLACHASRGRTKRTEIMFGSAGHAYIYMIYGMYFCLNFVTEKKDFPAAVLIRGVVRAPQGVFPSEHSGKHLASAATRLHNPILNGPGKLCRFFQIDKSLNGEDITDSPHLWVEDRGVKIKPSQIKSSKRIGVDYAGSYKHKPWRFYINNDN